MREKGIDKFINEAWFTQDHNRMTNMATSFGLTNRQIDVIIESSNTRIKEKPGHLQRIGNIGKRTRMHEWGIQNLQHAYETGNLTEVREILNTHTGREISPNGEKFSPLTKKRITAIVDSSRRDAGVVISKEELPEGLKVKLDGKPPGIAINLAKRYPEFKKILAKSGVGGDFVMVGPHGNIVLRNRIDPDRATLARTEDNF